jgi:hypothetical protein
VKEELEFCYKAMQQRRNWNSVMTVILLCSGIMHVVLEVSCN